MRKLLLTAALVLTSLSCSTSRLSSSTDARLEAGTLQHEGLDRSYWVYAPDSLDAGKPAPLVLALHGGGGTGKAMCTLAGGLMAVADEQGFLLACPDGVERHWNDGRGIDDWRAHAEQIDDVGFLTALVEQLSQQWSIDREAVFVTGISNGGLMSYRMACERADLVGGIAAVTASLPEALACEPSRPVSVLILNGTDDPLVPYEGGEVTVLRRQLGRVRSTEETYQFWAEINGCQGAAIVTAEPDLDPTDGTKVQRTSLGDCQDGTRVELYTIVGGGHTWPGGPQYLPVGLVGRVSRDLQRQPGDLGVLRWCGEDPLTERGVRSPGCTLPMDPGLPESLTDPWIIQGPAELPEPSADVADIQLLSLARNDTPDVCQVLCSPRERLVDDQVLSGADVEPLPLLHLDRPHPGEK